MVLHRPFEPAGLTGQFQPMFISRPLCRSFRRSFVKARSKIGIAAGDKAFHEHSTNRDNYRVCLWSFVDRSRSGIFVFYALFSQGPQPIRNSIGTTFGWRTRHGKFPIALEIVGANRPRGSQFVVRHVTLRLRPKFRMCNVLRGQSRDSVAKVERAGPNKHLS
jgi:hypothetical protein